MRHVEQECLENQNVRLGYEKEEILSFFLMNFDAVVNEFLIDFLKTN